MEALIDLDQLVKPLKAAARHSVLTDTNGRQYLWNDSRGQYDPLATDPPRLQPVVRTVSTIETLAEVVQEEARRANNTDGSYMTILLDDKGATFWPDDHAEQRHLQWRYERAVSANWENLTHMLDRTYSSLDFYKKLLSLAPSIQGIDDVLPAFAKTRVVDKSEFKDQNHFAGGDWSKNSGIKITVRGGDDDMELRIPDEIRFRLPVVRGSSVLYDLTALVEIRIERDVDKSVARFGLSIPTLELTKEQLLQDEADFLNKELSTELPHLLVGLNYKG